MKTNEKQLTYEAPEMETIEMTMESAIAGISDCEAFACGGVDAEEVCITDCGGADEEL